MTDYVDAASEKKGNGDNTKFRPVNANGNVPTASHDGPPRSTAAPIRKPLPSSDGGKATSSAKEHSQHNQAGAAALTSSAASSAAIQQPSKKRKAAHAAPSNSKDASSNGAVVQKPSGVFTDHLGPTGFSETNMMTFEYCGARLKNNILIADDGTVLAANGKPVMNLPVSKI